MRVLITGAGGQLGTDLDLTCVAAGDDVLALHRGQLDVTSRDEVLGALTTYRPTVVFHTAAWTAVDDCQADEERAIAVNGLAVRWMVEGCQRVGAHLVHLSTDYVFDGGLARPYHEFDDPVPRSVYGLSKLVGEHAALRYVPECTVVRTSWVCGRFGNNMVKTILRLAAERDQLAFVDDQLGCPTFTGDLAPMLRKLALLRLSGVVHVTNQHATSWYGFARDVVAAMGKNPDMVRPITTAELVPARPAPRPANSVLDNMVLRAAGIPLLRDYHEPLRETVKHLLG